MSDPERTLEYVERENAELWEQMRKAGKRFGRIHCSCGYDFLVSLHGIREQTINSIPSSRHQTCRVPPDLWRQIDLALNPPVVPTWDEEEDDAHP